MLGARKTEKYKKAVSVLLLIFCFAFGVVTILGLISNLTPNNVVLLRTNAGTVKLELTENITLEDNTADKLKQKLKITDTGTQGELGELVRVTSKNIMFKYTKADEKYYFTAIGNTLNTINENTYRTTASCTKIASKTRLEDFRAEVNNGDNYSGCTVKLAADIDLGKATWKPIGHSSDKPFSGTFDGQGHFVSNFTLDREGNLIGFFGYVKGGTISNVRLGRVEYGSASDDGTTVYGGLLVAYVGEQGRISNCFANAFCTLKIVETTKFQSVIVGGLIGLVSATTSVNINMCASYATIRVTCVGSDIKIVGGLVGGLAFESTDGVVATVGGCSISSCESKAKITVGSAKEMHVGGVVGAADRSSIENSIFNGEIELIKSGDVEVEYLMMGGIIGSVRANTTIESCVANVSGFSMGKLTIKEPEYVGKFSNKSNQGGDETYELYNFFKLIYPIYGGFYYTMTVNLKVALLIPAGTSTVKQYTMKPGYRPTCFICVANFLVSDQNYISEVKYMKFAVTNCYYTGSSECMNNDYTNYATKLSV